jgi:hypothetical protein
MTAADGDDNVMSGGNLKGIIAILVVGAYEAPVWKGLDA